MRADRRSWGAALKRPAVVRVLQVAVVVALLFVNLRWSRPYYNWDMLPYIAVAFHLGGASVEEAHARAYEVARETLPPAEYDLLTQANDYRRTVAGNPAAFVQQLPFYSVKPAYSLLILGLERAGLNPVRASVMISQASYLMIGILMLAWLGSLLSPPLAIVSTWGVMSAPFLLDLARFSSPDALSTALVLSALWLALEAGRFCAGESLLLLAIAVRPDNVLWLLVLAGYGARGPRRGRVAAAFAIAGIVACLALAHWSRDPGWTTLFYHSFVQRLAYPETFAPSLGPLGFARIYLRESHPAHLPPFLALFLVIGIWLFAHRLRRYGWRDTGVALLGIAGLFAGLHWLAYPDEDRFLAPAYVAVLVLLVRSLTNGPVVLVSGHRQSSEDEILRD
jgi:hypothetical protein